MPDDLRVELRRQLAPYRRGHPDVRWTGPQTWHLTLLFLGAVAPGRIGELRRLVESVAVDVQPYRVIVADGGGRVRRGEGVAWLGLSEGAGTLIRAATLVADRCPPDLTEGARPKRTPSAHLTVARKADREVVRALREQMHGRIGISWEVDRLQLVRSHLGPGGARYQTLHEATL